MRYKKGIKRLPDGKKKDFLLAYAEEQIAAIYDFIPYTKECAEIQSEIHFGYQTKLNDVIRWARENRCPVL